MSLNTNQIEKVLLVIDEIDDLVMKEFEDFEIADEFQDKIKFLKRILHDPDLGRKSIHSYYMQRFETIDYVFNATIEKFDKRLSKLESKFEDEYDCDCDSDKGEYCNECDE